MILSSHGIIGSQIVQFSGLLDTYTGAAAAYSLRLLRSAYTGYAIKVRRASDNTEQDIGFSNNELDTTSLASFCSGTNGFVTTWYDQSGNGYNATQTTAANQPQIVSSGSVITENGKPSLQFDGTDDRLISNTLASVYSGIDKYISGFLVDKSLSQTTPYGVSYSFGNSTNNTPGIWIGLDFGNGELVFVRRDDSSNIMTNNALANITSQTLIELISNGDTNDVYANSTNIISLTGSLGQTTLNTFTIGGLTRTSFAVPNNSKTQELILYSSDQSSNRTGIETNINAQYQIYWDGSQTSLLDTYGGSAAAYSLRALSSSYTGALIKVRRASDNAEQDIYAKYDGNLNTDALQSFCSGTNGFVTTWYDQSGNGRNATQTTAANQPQIVSGGSVITENGKPSVQFDGSSQYFNTSNPLIQLNTTIAIAFNFTRENVYGTPIGQWSSGTTGRTLMTTNQTISGGSSSNNLSFFNQTATGLVDITAPSGMNLIFWNIATGSGNYQVFNNGSNKFNATITTVATNVNTGIGVLSESTAAGHFDGVISELIFWGSIQTSRTGIETNINDFYSIY